MKTRRWMIVLLLAVSRRIHPAAIGRGPVLSRRPVRRLCLVLSQAPPAYAVAPVMAPIAAPVPAPPPPVVVPVQQVSYVPETTYRTQYQCVPVTSYKPSCEIDPCTGCAGSAWSR